MVDATVLRELGAETRTFRTVKGAMLWYAGQLAVRLRVNQGYEVGTAPRSQEARERTNATFAAIAGCLRSYHTADLESPLPGEHVLWLVAWYETTWGDGQFLADKAGLSRWAFTRRCRKTERTLRRRMECAGLLEDRDVISS